MTTLAQNDKVRKPRFDLAGLDAPPSVQSARKWAAEVETGQKKLVDFPIDEVIEDPNNPRKSFDEDALQALAKSIKKQGVMQPIPVRAKNAEGKYVIINGARRFRASKIAGKATIPGFVVPESELVNYDDYGQVIDNTQHENLSAEEISEFIFARIARGDKKNEIAERLCIRPQLISAYLAIQEVSDNVLALFRAGKIDGIEPLYELKRLQEKAPEQAARLITDAEASPQGRITLSLIRAQKKGEGSSKPPVSEPPLGNTQESQSTSPASDSGSQVGEGPSSQNVTSGEEDEQTEGASNGVSRMSTIGQQHGADDDSDNDDEGTSRAKKGDQDDDEQGGITPPNTTQLPYHNPDAHKPPASRDGRVPDPNHIKKPLLLGEIDGEPVKVLLARRPTSPGLAHVSYESTGKEDEVAIDRIKLTMLSDMKVQETA